MRPRARRRWRAAAAAVAGLAAALPVLSTPTPGGALPAPARQAAQARPGPEIRLIEQSATSAADGDFVAFFSVAGAPAGSDVAVDIHDRIETAEDLRESSSDDPPGYLDTFPVLPLPGGGPAPQSSGFGIRLFGPGQDRPPGAWAYRLSEPGVYPVRLRLRGPDGELLTSIVTYLVREPAAGDQDRVEPAEVSLLTDVDLHDVGEPTAADGVEPAADRPVDPSLLADMDDVLAAFAEHPEVAASFAVAPRTAERLANDESAASTLAALTAELRRDDRDLIGAPYVDVDPAALVAAGLGDELARQADLGTATLATTLGLPFTDLWALDGRIDAATVGALQAQGVTRLVVPESALVDPEPGAVVSLPGGPAATLAVTSVPGQRSLTGEDPVLASHQLLGRLAALATVNPDGARVVVRIDPAEVERDTLDRVLDLFERPGGFLRVRTTHDLFADTPAAPVGALAQPATVDLGGYPQLLPEVRALVDSYASMTPDRPLAIDPLVRRLSATASRDLTADQRERRTRAVEAELRARFDAVSTPASDRVTLGARNAQFPLPITSTLDEPVSVLIELQASDRLDLPDEPIPATLASERTTVQVPVGAKVTGDTPLRITVRTPDGRVILSESRYTVRSTAVSGVGVLLTIGAGLFLAVWWGRHWWRNRHGGRHARRRGHRAPPRVPTGDEPVFAIGPDRVRREDVTPTGPKGSNPA